MGVVRYWIEHRGHFSTLPRVALRINGTPTSSAWSERLVVVLSRLVIADQNSLGDGVIEDMTFLKSVFTGLTYEDFVGVVDYLEK